MDWAAKNGHVSPSLEPLEFQPRKVLRIDDNSDRIGKMPFSKDQVAPDLLVAGVEGIEVIIQRSGGHTLLAVLRGSGGHI